MKPFNALELRKLVADAEASAKKARREELALYCLLMKLIDLLPDDKREEFFSKEANVEEDWSIICDKACSLVEEFGHYVY